MATDATFILAVMSTVLALLSLILIAWVCRPISDRMNIRYVADLGHSPVRGSRDAAASDLRADKNYTLEPGEKAMINLRIRAALPTGTAGLLTVRSSIGLRELSLVNQVGTIDSDYRGFIIATLRNDSTETQHIAAGERVCQFMILPHIIPNWVQVDVLDDTERGNGGFGSTGTHTVADAPATAPTLRLVSSN